MEKYIVPLKRTFVLYPFYILASFLYTRSFCNTEEIVNW